MVPCSFTFQTVTLGPVFTGVVEPLVGLLMSDDSSTHIVYNLLGVIGNLY